MKPTTFKETNMVFDPGNNPNTDQLPVCIASHESNGEIPTIISKWKLDEQEINRIQETGELWITVMGVQLPPIGATVFNPFQDLNFKPLKIK